MVAIYLPGCHSTITHHPEELLLFEFTALFLLPSSLHCLALAQAFFFSQTFYAVCLELTISVVIKFDVSLALRLSSVDVPNAVAPNSSLAHHEF